MEKNKREIGTNYERLAGDLLRKNGYEIVAYNFRCAAGEIDIIAKDGEYLVFCEVKYRKTTRAGYPLEAVSAAKQRRISKCAQYYIYKHQLYDVPCRFDVIGILGTKVQILKNAFDFME